MSVSPPPSAISVVDSGTITPPAISRWNWWRIDTESIHELAQTRRRRPHQRSRRIPTDRTAQSLRKDNDSQSTMNQTRQNLSILFGEL
ncbi:hypothetical protein LINGRAHAP2_LOCUS15532 [Linum grandiflorum]